MVIEDLWPLNSQGSDGKRELTMGLLVAFNLGIQHYDFSTTANSVFPTLKATCYGAYPLRHQMTFEIAITQPVTTSVTTGTSFAIAFIVYASPELETPSILTIDTIAVTALWQL